MVSLGDVRPRRQLAIVHFDQTVFAQKVLCAEPTSGDVSTKGQAHLGTQSLLSVSAMWGYNHARDMWIGEV